MTLEEAKKEKLEYYIYDENRYIYEKNGFWYLVHKGKEENERLLRIQHPKQKAYIKY